MLSEVFLSSFKPLTSMPWQGDRYLEKDFSIFWGSSFDQYSSIKRAFTELHEVQQVHGCNVIESHATPQTADGHFTTRTGIPLLIKTADCLPVFLYKKPFIVALHIGWRGLAQGILTKTLMANPDLKNGKIFVGPHIKQRHFDLKYNFAQELLDFHKITINQALKNKMLIPSPRQNNHFLVDLSSILKNEISLHSLNLVYESTTSTYSSPRHYSHRRYPYQKGRQYSFIIKNKIA